MQLEFTVRKKAEKSNERKEEEMASVAVCAVDRNQSMRILTVYGRSISHINYLSINYYGISIYNEFFV